MCTLSWLGSYPWNPPALCPVLSGAGSKITVTLTSIMALKVERCFMYHNVTSLDVSCSAFYLGCFWRSFHRCSVPPSLSVGTVTHAGSSFREERGVMWQEAGLSLPFPSFPLPVYLLCLSCIISWLLLSFCRPRPAVVCLRRGRQGFIIQRAVDQALCPWACGWLCSMCLCLCFICHSESVSPRATTAAYRCCLTVLSCRLPLHSLPTAFHAPCVEFSYFFVFLIQLSAGLPGRGQIERRLPNSTAEKVNLACEMSTPCCGR